MKQAQSDTRRYRPSGSWRIANSASQRGWSRTDRPRTSCTLEPQQASVWPFGQLFVGVLAGLWFIVTLPFRLIFWIIAWAGRLTVVLLGFSLMVVGMALWASPLFLVGIPMFLIGLVLTLRCLD